MAKRLNYLNLDLTPNIENIGRYPTLQMHNDAKYNDVLAYKTRVLAGYRKIYDETFQERLDIEGNSNITASK